jgi:hypothetical protein
MREDRLRTSKHAATRKVLRVAGLVILSAGAILVLIGIGSFFAAFGSFGPPRYFWCAFLGMPLLFVGGAMAMLGFMGAVQRYVAGESAPVAKDVVNYMGENTQPGVKAFARAVTEGVRDGMAGDQDAAGEATEAGAAEPDGR